MATRSMPAPTAAARTVAAPRAGSKTSRVARAADAQAQGDGTLADYRSRRDFARTPEPASDTALPHADGLRFVIQKHAATRLHYDLRLEVDGVFASWAVPKGPSFDPADKRIAMRTEDHPLAYGDFEGTIPRGQYGAGSVIIWDRGRFEPVGDAAAGLAAGKLVFRLDGHKLAGLWELVRIRKPGEKQDPWILFKKRDEHVRARADYDVVQALPDSVSGLGMPTPVRAVRQADAAAGRRSAGKPAAEPAAAEAAATKPAAEFDPTRLDGARRAPQPTTLAPQLAALVSTLPARGPWRFEIKFDGYRLLARIADGKATLYTRAGHDWTSKMPALAQAFAALPLRSAWLDGEIVVQGKDGAPDFAALQQAIDKPKLAQRIVCYLFDLPYLDGVDLRGVALVERRRLLERVLARAGSARLRFSAAFDADAQTMLASAEKMGLEGVIAKRDDARYTSGRSESWVKLKLRQRQEFVVAGYTLRSDGSPQVGSLLLGVHDEAGKLLPVGSVGTGWDGAEATRLLQRLRPMARPTPPYGAPPPGPGRWSRRPAGEARWVEPTQVVEVAFGGWTPEQQLRHAVYRGLREDKPAREVVREKAREVVPDAAPAETPGAKSAARKRKGEGKPSAPSAASAAAATRAALAGSATGGVGTVKVTHPERVVDAASGLTKLDLVRYYESVAPWMLPHLKGRPVSLVRAPDGVAGAQFFQKHDEARSIVGLKRLPAELWPGHDALLAVPDAKALVSAAQMNVVEFHTWNTTVRHIDRPDRIVFDLDPGEGTSWTHVREGALLVRTLLDSLGLESWLKTSGGKGLHVVVPLAPRADSASVKDFAQAAVAHLARTIPSRFVAKSGPANRVGKIFVDYLRNSLGATTVAAFSARARPGLGVSMPIAWDALAGLKRADAYTVANARDHLSFQTDDPWAGYAGCRQTLTRARKALGLAAAPSATARDAPAEGSKAKGSAQATPTSRRR